MKPNDEIKNRYTLLKHIEAGGQGTVWQAQDTEKNQVVAIKFSKEKTNTTNSSRKKSNIIKEAELMISLEHKDYAIIKILDCGTDEIHGDYYVMEYFPDKSLKKFIEQKNCKLKKRVPYTFSSYYIPLTEIIMLLRPIAKALDYARSKNTLHKDLKPSNILVNYPKEYVLSDFNLEYGWIPIMAPEQLERFLNHTASTKAINITWLSDLFSFGCCLYWLTTEQYPFKLSKEDSKLLNEKKVQKFYDWHHSTLPKPLPRELKPINPDLQNDEVNALLQCLIATEPEARTNNGQIKGFEDVLDKLEKAIPKEKKPGFLPLSAKWTLIIAYILILLASLFQATTQNNFASVTSTASLIADNSTPTLTATPSGPNDITATVPPTSTESPTPEPIDTDTPVPTETFTPKPTDTPIPTETFTPKPTNTPVPTETFTPRPTNTPVGIVNIATPTLSTTDQCKPSARITSPLNEATISGSVSLQGDANNDDFDYYKIEYWPPNGEDWTCCVVNPRSFDVEDGNLGTWDTTKVPNGEYSLNLHVVKNNGQFNQCEIKVVVEN